MKIRQEVMIFATAMEEVLQRNDHKKGWHQMTRRQIRRRILDEFMELSDAIATGNQSGMLHEACDLANFCMMLYCNNQPADGE